MMASGYCVNKKIISGRPKNLPKLHPTYTQWPGYLLSYYLANKRSLHVRFEGLEILTLIKK